MKRLYSKTTLTTYLVGVHADIPKDAVEISEERYLETIGNPAPGMFREHDESGLPYLAALPAPDDEQRAKKERAWRDNDLASVMWLRERHRDQQEIGGNTTLSGEQFAELLSYMQSLRDWPQSLKFPDVDHRPSAPAWIADQTE